VPWFQIHARGHHGYPQPEDDYQVATYETVCLRCGRHGPQLSPFRMRKRILAPNSHFIQLNWVFDVLFVHPDVVERMKYHGLRGFSVLPVLNTKGTEELPHRVQLLLDTVVDCAEISELPVVTCRANNEESGWALPGAVDPGFSYCGKLKNHPPTDLVLLPGPLVNAPDLFLTEQWFGSGASAHGAIICSQTFVELYNKADWRGLQFSSVQHEGHSARRK